MIQKFEQFKDSLNENIDSLNESKKPVVELKKDKDRPWSWGGKTFDFVDPFISQLDEIDINFSKKYHAAVKGGWMDYDTCKEITQNLLTVELVDHYSDKVFNILKKTFKNLPQ